MSVLSSIALFPYFLCPDAEGPEEQYINIVPTKPFKKASNAHLWVLNH